MTTNAMTGEVLDLISLDADSSMVEAIAKRLRKTILQKTLSTQITGYRAWRCLKEMEKVSREIHSDLMRLDVSTEDDRNNLLEIARQISKASETIWDAHNHLEQSELSKRIPIFGTRILIQLSDLSCDLEDMAETAALGASEEFAQAVQKRLETVTT